MTVYAHATSVPVERSRAEIERLLTRYGAERFASGWSPGSAMIQFSVRSRDVMFMLPLPAKDDARFWRHGRSAYRKVAPSEAERRWQQECRSRWRALALVIKAKLEAVESGITTFEAEFLSHFIVGNGKTVADIMVPRLQSGAPLLLSAPQED